MMISPYRFVVADTLRTQEVSIYVTVTDFLVLVHSTLAYHNEWFSSAEISVKSPQKWPIYSLKNSFLDQSIQKNIPINFDLWSTD